VEQQHKHRRQKQEVRPISKDRRYALMVQHRMLAVIVLLQEPVRTLQHHQQQEVNKEQEHHQQQEVNKEQEHHQQQEVRTLWLDRSYNKEIKHNNNNNNNKQRELPLLEQHLWQQWLSKRLIHQYPKI
jgi:uncharacterized membrane protein YhiD involved in acid resistance